VVLECLRKLGLEIEHDEAECYMQLWRYVGWIIGCDRDLTPTSQLSAWQLAELIRATQGGPDDDARALAAALFDSPFTGAKTPSQLRTAHVQRELGRALSRFFIGDEVADQLALPRSRYAHLIPVIRRFTMAAERVRLRVPAARRAAIASGERYWDRVVEIGLAGATAEFRPPEKLAVAA
jgi:hypothetical protein